MSSACIRGPVLIEHVINDQTGRRDTLYILSDDGPCCFSEASCGKFSTEFKIAPVHALFLLS